MKFSVYLAALSLAATLNSAYATDMGNPDEVAEYCKAQAELTGIEDNDEKNQYISDCIESSLPANERAQEE